MTTDFRALCAELIASWDADGCDWKPQHQARWEATVNRARAALADEPAVPEGKKPTRDELWELWLRLNNELPDRPAAVAEFWEHAQIDARARAALAEPEPEGPTDEELRELWNEGWDTSEEYGAFKHARAVLAHWGHPAQPPADGEVAELVEWLRETGDTIQPSHLAEHQRYKRAAELLQRHVVVPVAVSERLPGPEDCADEGWAWFYTPRGDWVKAVLPVSPAYTHWLPAHALPLPEVNNG
jgi:hypothetical protein